MEIICRRSVLVLALLGGVGLTLSGCGQKGSLYLTNEPDQAPQAVEVDENELGILQEELEQQDTQNKEALKSKPYEGSLIPSP